MKLFLKQIPCGKGLVLKLDNYGKDVETISLQKVHVNQLLTFHRNYKQVAKGKAMVKAKGKTPMTAKEGNQIYPKGRSNEESVCVRTLKTILRAQKIKFPSKLYEYQSVIKLRKEALDLLNTHTVPSF